MSLEDKMEVDRIKNKKFTVDFNAKFCKDNIENAPCNIWGYIKALEARILQLEKK